MYISIDMCILYIGAVIILEKNLFHPILRKKTRSSLQIKTERSDAPLHIFCICIKMHVVEILQTGIVALRYIGKLMFHLLMTHTLHWSFYYVRCKFLWFKRIYLGLPTSILLTSGSPTNIHEKYTWNLTKCTYIMST